VGEGKGNYYDKLEYRFNATGKILWFIRASHDDGIEHHKRTYTYDEKDQLIEKKHYNEGVLFKTETFIYDPAGNLVEEYSVDADKYKSGTKYKYNEQKLVIEELSYADGEPNSIVTNTYTIDSHNNWTQMIVRLDGKVNTVTDRLITYW
jgi:YD repeat-containing protein